MGLIGVSYFDLDHPENFSEDSARIAQTKNVRGVFVNEEFNSTVLTLFTDFYLSKSQTDSLNHSVQETLMHFGFNEFHNRFLGVLIQLQFNKAERLIITGFKQPLAQDLLNFRGLVPWCFLKKLLKWVTS